MFKLNNKATDVVEDRLARLQKKMNDQAARMEEQAAGSSKSDDNSEENPGYNDVRYHKQQMINVEPVRQDYKTIKMFFFFKKCFFLGVSGFFLGFQKKIFVFFVCFVFLSFFKTEIIN